MSFLVKVFCIHGCSSIVSSSLSYIRCLVKKSFLTSSTARDISKDGMRESLVGGAMAVEERLALLTFLADNLLAVFTTNLLAKRLGICTRTPKASPVLSSVMFGLAVFVSKRHGYFLIVLLFQSSYSLSCRILFCLSWMYEAGYRV